MNRSNFGLARNRTRENAAEKYLQEGKNTGKKSEKGTMTEQRPSGAV